MNQKITWKSAKSDFNAIQTNWKPLKYSEKLLCTTEELWGDSQLLRPKSMFLPPTNNQEQDVCPELITLVSRMIYKASNI